MRASEIKAGCVYEGARGDRRKVINIRYDCFARSRPGMVVHYKRSDGTFGACALATFARWAARGVTDESVVGVRESG